jgi:hypothetical protein|tara:strand:- start:349 stop:543 length:195 start_codon:yes stop_codon:yes gene_type:complete
MKYKAYNPLTGKIEPLSEEDKEVLDALSSQFEKDAQELIAEREIVKEILKNHLITKGSKNVCKD